ncbi:MAG: sce7725 family protein, partial [Terracidiphilus sp.]
MYHPYFRGKQYELITIREMAPTLKSAGFRPIIEPVRKELNGLHKALDALVEVDGRAIIIVNPHHGELHNAGAPLAEFLEAEYLGAPGVSAGILLRQNTTPDEAVLRFEQHAAHNP